MNETGAAAFHVDDALVRGMQPWLGSPATTELLQRSSFLLDPPERK